MLFTSSKTYTSHFNIYKSAFAFFSNFIIKQYINMRFQRKLKKMPS